MATTIVFFAFDPAGKFGVRRHEFSTTCAILPLYYTRLDKILRERKRHTGKLFFQFSFQTGTFQDKITTRNIFRDRRHIRWRGLALQYTCWKWTVFERKDKKTAGEQVYWEWVLQIYAVPSQRTHELPTELGWADLKDERDARYEPNSTRAVSPQLPRSNC